MFRILIKPTITKTSDAPFNTINKRHFWEYVNMMFNKPDPERIKTLGPDRACAEWVLRNGGSVIWTDGKKLADYNSLPPEEAVQKHIEVIDGTDSGISHYGFPHLNGCKKLKKIILNNNRYIEDRAMEGLSYGKDTLTHVQVSNCKGVTDSGVKLLTNLSKLEVLVLYSLASVDNLDECKKFISSKLSKCSIQGGDNSSKESKAI